MNEEEFEEQLNAFWETNDEWQARRLQAVAGSNPAGPTLCMKSLLGLGASIQREHRRTNCLPGTTYGA